MKYKTIFLLSFLFIFSKIANSQDLVSKIRFNNEFSWSQIEKKNQEEIKSEFLTQIKDFDRLVNENMYTPKELLKALHVVDFDGDSFLDIIYEGLSGSEPTMVVIYLNSKKGFKEVFKDFNEIMKIESSNGKISGIYIDEPACCGDPISTLKYYQINYKNTVTTFEKVIESRYFSEYNSSLPKKQFDKPIKFRIDNENYSLRYAPEIKDTSASSWDDIKGNVIGVIRKNEIGYALGKATDSTGRIWWFSAFAPNTKFSSRFNSESGDNNYWKLGWISSKYVTEVE